MECVIDFSSISLFIDHTIKINSSSLEELENHCKDREIIALCHRLDIRNIMKKLFPNAQIYTYKKLVPNIGDRIWVVKPVKRIPTGFYISLSNYKELLYVYKIDVGG
jgi:hypothetical protein